MLPSILNLPNSVNEWNLWTFHHRTSHELIRRAILTQFRTRLSDYIIDPISFQAPKQWLEANQQFHTDMNGVLGVPGSDLEDVDLRDQRQMQAWIYLHWQEHQTAESKLGVGS